MENSMSEGNCDDPMSLSESDDLIDSALLLDLFQGVRTVLSNASDVQCNQMGSARLWRERQPNWLSKEVRALIQAKRQLHLYELRSADGRELMHSDTTKWARISTAVKEAGFSPIVREGAACKSKWNQLFPEYKRIADYLARTGTNSSDYWSMSPADRKVLSLSRDFYVAIEEWYGQRPSMQPLHSRDLLSTDDGNYRPPPTAGSAAHDKRRMQHFNDKDDDFDVPLTEEEELGRLGPHLLPSQRATASAMLATVSTDPVVPSSSGRACQRTGVLDGVQVHTVSSSNTATRTSHRQAGNTGVRQKSVSGHTLIAKVTKSTGETITQQIKDMAEASRVMERSKIELQESLFSRQLEYQLQRDAKLRDNAKSVDKNAKLSILKQGELVECLTNLCSALSAGVHECSVASMEGRNVRASYVPLHNDMQQGQTLPVFPESSMDPNDTD